MCYLSFLGYGRVAVRRSIKYFLAALSSQTEYQGHVAKKEVLLARLHLYYV
jgi:hypothetical protein